MKSKTKMNDEMKLFLDSLSDQLRELKTDVGDLKKSVHEIQTRRTMLSSVYTWLGGIILALLSTDAVLDLIVNHWPHIK